MIKDLMILHFKNIENKNKIQFNCGCFVGSSAEIDFSDFLQKVKEINNKKEDHHYCKQHNNIGKKYCKDCEIWLCDECIGIHSVFNKNHSLSNNESPLKKKCKYHVDNFNEYYCLNCNEEICSLCITKIGSHSDHKTIQFEKFNFFKENIKSHLRYKTYDECSKHLEDIKETNNNEYNMNIQKINDMTGNLINKIKNIQGNYIREISNKCEHFNKIIEIMKECYRYFYLMISNENPDFNSLNFLKQITEIIDIKTFYSNFNSISKAMKMIDNFSFNNIFSYDIKTNETPYQFSFNFEKIFKKMKKIRTSSVGAHSLTVQSKYNINQNKPNEIKYVKSIKTRIGTIYSIIKTNINEIAVACGNEILIIDDITKETNDSFSLFNSFPSLRGHIKNVLCLALLSENILASAGEDPFIKIWNIEKKECINTIKGKYKHIYSLLKYQDNILIAGIHNQIKIFDITKNEELATLIGHTKSICSIIKINEHALVSSSYDNLIKIWNLNNQFCEFTLFGHDSPVFCILMLKDGRLASGSGTNNKSIKIWNLKQKKCEFTLIGHKREVRDIKQISNMFILTASVDKTIKVWNIYKKICVQTLVSHYDGIYCLCLIDNNKFVSGGRDQDIILWKC